MISGALVGLVIDRGKMPLNDAVRSFPANYPRLAWRQNPDRYLLQSLNSKQFPKLRHELLDILEVQIYRGISNIGNLVELTQSLHQHFAPISVVFLSRSLDS